MRMKDFIYISNMTDSECKLFLDKFSIFPVLAKDLLLSSES